MIIGPYTKIVKLRKQIQERDETIKRVVAENKQLKEMYEPALRVVRYIQQLGLDIHAPYGNLLIPEQVWRRLLDTIQLALRAAEEYEQSRSGRNTPHNDKPDSPESPAARPAERISDEEGT